MKIGNHHDQSSEKEYVRVIARHLPKSRKVKLAASVVGHPNNGEMVPPRPAKAVYSSPKTVGSIVEKFYTLTFGMEITNVTYADRCSSLYRRYHK